MFRSQRILGNSLLNMENDVPFLLTSPPASAASSRSCCGCPPRRPSAAETGRGFRGRWPPRTAGRCSPPRPCRPPVPETTCPRRRTPTPLLTAACSAVRTPWRLRAPGYSEPFHSPHHHMREKEAEN